MKKSTSLLAAIVGLGVTTFALRGQSAPQTGAAQTVSFDAKVAPLALVDTAGKAVTVGDWDKSKATVLMFVATKCPVSNDYNARMASLAKTYTPKGIRFVGINSNKAENGAEVAAHAKGNDFSFAVLKDPQNKIADRFGARVTPEVYVVSPAGDLIYRGRIDNSQREENVNDRSLQLALDAVLSGKAIAEKETRAFGCSIKREN
ncbi:MAG: redoxin domain-containing protein [Armatimonadetes bacterium]|nr:redoxin domain-containing protein [Armatimonadota bacterium]